MQRALRFFTRNVAVYPLRHVEREIATVASARAAELSSAPTDKPSNRILSGYGVTIFEQMSQAAAKHGSVNLGQGFPDVDGPPELKQKAADMLLSESNQYPPMLGIPELRQATANHFNRYYNLDIDWETETLVTAGATEMLTASLLALLNPGDEVVLIEPTYDCYLPIIRLAGAVPMMSRVTPPHWELDTKHLSSIFSERTKLVLLNNPQNPSGKAYTTSELEFIADLVLKYNCYAVCDEVYEHLVFDGRKHVSLMSLPGMRDRCIKIGSAGKTFSMTGWKVGYSVAPAPILKSIAKAHQFITFTTPPNLQHAVAYGLSQQDSYFDELANDMQSKRDRLSAGLSSVGFDVIRTAASYFVVADIRPLGFDNDVAFCSYITTEAGVTAVPMSAFYEGNDDSVPKHFVRFCCAKRSEVLDSAIARLTAHFNKSA